MKPATIKPAQPIHAAQKVSPANTTIHYDPSNLPYIAPKVIKLDIQITSGGSHDIHETNDGLTFS